MCLQAHHGTKHLSTHGMSERISDLEVKYAKALCTQYIYKQSTDHDYVLQLSKTITKNICFSFVLVS